MAYFNHAFSKAFLAKLEVVNGTATSAFTAGQFGTVRGSDWTSLLNPTGLAAGDLLYLVQGSYIQNDTIGNNPGHGGYKETVKSKGINPRYISKLWSSSCETAVAATTTVSVASDCAPCGENLFLRLDVKGSPALRFLNHNAYAIGDSSGDAKANGASIPSLCCTGAQTHLDPAVALAAAAQMLLADPIISPFATEGSSGNVATLGAPIVAGTGYTTAAGVATTGGSGTGLKLNTTDDGGGGIASAVINPNNGGKGYKVGDVITITGGGGNATITVLTVAAGGVIVETTAVPYTSYTIAQMLDGSTYTASTDPVTDGVSASVTFQGAYVDTQFGDCSFDTRDHYNKEPVQLIASVLDETGNPCNDCGVITSTAGKMAQTTGETVLRDLLLTEAYMQSPFNQGNKDSARIQEIEQSNDIVNAVTRTDLYKVYYLQHSIPRWNNPTGVFDNDQYVYKIYVKCDDSSTISAMNTLFGHIVTLAGTWGNQIAFDQDVDDV